MPRIWTASLAAAALTMVGADARADVAATAPPPAVAADARADVAATAPPPAVAADARADDVATAPPPGTLLSDDTFELAPGGDIAVDGGLVLALPAALPTGMAAGLGAGFAVRRGAHVELGARLEGLTATESSMTWTVTDRELRARATAAAVTDAGRAQVGLRVGLGGNLVHETRDRNQGARAGLTGTDLEQRALALEPAVDLALAVELHIAGHWLLAMSGGPTLDIVNAADLHAGWTAQLGVGWRP